MQTNTLPQEVRQLGLDDVLCTVREACTALKIGNTKCYELIGSGHLEVVHLGPRCTRVKKSSVARLVQHGLA